MSLKGKGSFIKEFIKIDLGMWLIGMLVGLIILRRFLHQDIGISILITVFNGIWYLMGGLHAISRINKIIICSIKEMNDEEKSDI